MDRQATWQEWIDIIPQVEPRYYPKVQIAWILTPKLGTENPITDLPRVTL